MNPDMGKSTSPRSSTGENSGETMKTLIVPVLLSGKKIPVGSSSMGILMLKKIRSCKSFGGPVSPVKLQNVCESVQMTVAFKFGTNVLQLKSSIFASVQPQFECYNDSSVD